MKINYVRMRVGFGDRNAIALRQEGNTRALTFYFLVCLWVNLFVLNYWSVFLSLNSLKVLYTTVYKFINGNYKQNKAFLLKKVKLTVFPYFWYFSINYIKREKNMNLLCSSRFQPKFEIIKETEMKLSNFLIWQWTSHFILYCLLLSFEEKIGCYN